MIRSAGAGSSSGSDTIPVELAATAGARRTLAAGLGLLGSDRARTAGGSSRKALAAISKVSRSKLNAVGAA